MSLTRMVNGRVVAISPEEEATILAEWAANDPKNKPVAPSGIVQLVNAIRNDPAALAILKDALK